MAPVARNPNQAGTGRITPITTDPDPPAATPLIVAGDPDRPRTGTGPAAFMVTRRRSRRADVHTHNLGRGLAHSSKRRHGSDERQREDGKTSNFHNKGWTSPSPRRFKESSGKSFQFINLRRLADARDTSRYLRSSNRPGDESRKPETTEPTIIRASVKPTTTASCVRTAAYAAASARTRLTMK